MSKVVLFGATGYAGGNIAAELVRRGHEVVGVARDASRAAEGITVESGSIFDADFVNRVAAGADQIVVALPAFPRAEGDQLLIEALPALTTAAIANNARLSFVGGAGSLNVAPGGPRLVDTDEFPAEFKPEALAHGEVLNALRESDEQLNWFYVSPAATFGAWNAGERTGTFRLGGDELLADENGVSAISGADYAIAYVDEIEQGNHPRGRFTVSY